MWLAVCLVWLPAPGPPAPGPPPPAPGPSGRPGWGGSASRVDGAAGVAFSGLLPCSAPRRRHWPASPLPGRLAPAPPGRRAAGPSAALGAAPWDRRCNSVASLQVPGGTGPWPGRAPGTRTWHCVTVRARRPPSRSLAPRRLHWGPAAQTRPKKKKKKKCCACLLFVYLDPTAETQCRGTVRCAAATVCSGGGRPRPYEYEYEPACPVEAHALLQQPLPAAAAAASSMQAAQFNAGRCSPMHHQCRPLLTNAGRRCSPTQARRCSPMQAAARCGAPRPPAAARPQVPCSPAPRAACAAKAQQLARAGAPVCRQQVGRRGYCRQLANQPASPSPAYPVPACARTRTPSARLDARRLRSQAPRPARYQILCFPRRMLPPGPVRRLALPDTGYFPGACCLLAPSVPRPPFPPSPHPSSLIPHPIPSRPSPFHYWPPARPFRSASD